MAAKQYFFVGYDVRKFGRIPEIVRVTAKEFKEVWEATEPSTVSENGGELIPAKIKPEVAYFYGTSENISTLYTKYRDAEIALLNEVRFLKNQADAFVSMVEDATKELVEKERNKKIIGLTVYRTDYDYKKEHTVIKEIKLTKGVVKGCSRLQFDDNGKPEQIYYKGHYWCFNRLEVIQEAIEELEDEFQSNQSLLEMKEADIKQYKKDTAELKKIQRGLKGDLIILKETLRKAGVK